MAKFHVLVCNSCGVVGWGHDKERIQIIYGLAYGICPFCNGKMKIDTADCRINKNGSPNKSDLVRKYGLVRI